MWGRGSHGGGGFGSYKAIEHIDPESLGLSVALFGQAWTWESEQDKSGWTWEKWWAYERKLWLGPETDGEDIHVPIAPRREGEPECIHGKSQPLIKFFPQSPPPNPADLAFHTSFGVGVGRAWFVNGAKVLQTENGWTDIDKQGSLGNLLWPRPTLTWEGEELAGDKIPKASCTLNLEDAWNGGNSLRLTVSGTESDAEDAFFRCVWLPIQSLAITPLKSYEAHVIYKFDSSLSGEADVGLSVKLASDQGQRTINVKPISSGHTNLPGGWATLSMQFELPTDYRDDVLVNIGVVIGYAMDEPAKAYDFSLSLGQINVFPTSPVASSAHQPRLLWADFAASTDNDNKVSGVLTWEVAASFAPLTNIAVTSPEDPNPAWILNSSNKWFPEFLYFNIYMQVHTSDGTVSSPKTATFIGTTGLDGRRHRFFVDPKILPDEAVKAGSVRYLVQAVTDRGEVLKWDQCVFVDVDK